MHLLTTSSTGLDEIVEAVDLGQSPGDIAILSFADSDLAALAAAWEIDRAALPSLRLAHLRDLRHPMSVDLWIDRRRSSARRAGLVALWRRPAGGARSRARQRACGPAGRRPRRSAA
jgi:cobalamin biosynthesis Mg chelatase CobN